MSIFVSMLIICLVYTFEQKKKVKQISVQKTRKYIERYYRLSDFK